MDNYNKNGTANLFQEGVPPEPEQGQQVIESTPMENFENWDKQKSIDAYRKLQQKNTELDRQIKELSAKSAVNPEIEYLKQELAKVTSQLQPPVPEIKEPVRPTKPTKPQGYDPSDVDALVNSDSPFYKYRIAKERYDEEMDNYLVEKEKWDNHKFQKINQFVEISAREREEVQRKNSALQQLMQAGATPDEAREIFETFTASNNPLTDAQKLVEYNRFVKNGNKQPQQKYYPPSPSLLPNKAQEQSDETTKFMSEVKGKGTKHLFITTP